jgi:GT2 family glycosyltransferase
MADIRLAVITNSFNRKDLLEQALPSLLAALSRLSFPSAVVVFDAGSTDHSQEFVTQFALSHSSTPIHLITPSTPETSSFADGCNQAIAHAHSLYPSLDYALFYETDNLFNNPDALVKAVDLLDSQPALGGTGFTVERLDGRKIGYGCRFPSPLSLVLGQKLAARFCLDAPNPPTWTQTANGLNWTRCDIVFTSPLLIRVQAWLDAGPMNAKVFPFTDSDLEWCWRAHHHGWPMAVLDVSGVIHDNAGALSNWSARRVLWFHQSRLRLLRLLHPGQSLFLKPLLLFRHLLEIALLIPLSVIHPQSKQSLQTRLKLARGVFSDYASVLSH